MYSSVSQEYASFRAAIPMKKISVRGCKGDIHDWVVFDAGPRSVTCPLLFLPPLCANADVYFRQLLSLSAFGYRVISVQYPTITKITEWCASLNALLVSLQINMIHLFASAGGGFLAQKFAEINTHSSPRVCSLILCNSFSDMSLVRDVYPTSAYVWLSSTSRLRKSLIGPVADSADPDITAANEFISKECHLMSSSEVTSRLSLMNDCTFVDSQHLLDIPVTIIEICDAISVPTKARETMYKCYPQAKVAHLKTGGDFPFLSRPDEINVFCRLHCKPFSSGDWANGRLRHSPCDPIHPDLHPTGTQ